MAFEYEDPELASELETKDIYLTALPRRALLAHKTQGNSSWFMEW